MSGIFGPGGGGGGGGLPPNTIVRTYIPGVALLDAVYQTPVADTVDKASAVSILTTPVLGLVTAMDTPAVGQCWVQYDGDVMGMVGLTPGDVYMLSKTPGQLVLEFLTGDPGYPNAPGNVVQAVGVAVSPTVFSIAIQDQLEL